ncbi:hypothetical protein OQX63_05865 [Pedobacter sp. PF22-3]|uniref:hypothetical protein n=1 Tax=Pedobacter sp. PF22-3 TaxID=2994467 RepID=UPI0022476612|nr:hypothetical protein [Pedobacter sp. PF22-3]MCX2492989.1 hypothetical protein [Pedobacter sp. PF22-3]
MPTSRNRKKKKPVKKVKLPSSEKLNEMMRSKGLAPDPIKMKYFEAQFNDQRESTYEERLEILRSIGKEAAENFPEKYRTIQDWFIRYDQPQLLSFAFYYFMTSPAGYDEEAVTGSIAFPPYYQELLQAFALTLPRTYNPQPFSSEVQKFRDDFKEISKLNRSKYFNFPESVITADDLPFHLLRTEMMMHTTAVRNWSYEHKMKEVTLDLAASISSAFKTQHGFDPVVFLNVIYKMFEEIQERVNVHRLKTVEIMRHKQYNKVMDAYEEQFPVEKTPPTARTYIWEKFGKNLRNLQAMFLMHSDLYLEKLFTFEYSTLAEYAEGNISKEKLKEAFSYISMEFGDLAGHDSEHFLLGNPVHEKPFIKTSDDTVFSSLWSVITHFSLGILETFCTQDDLLRKKYNDARAGYLEDQVEKLFKTAFPMAKVYAGSKWPGRDGKEYENDLLVIIDKFALVIEAKAGLMSPPAKRGAPERLFKTLQGLIEEPSDQALRFIDYLKDNPTQLSLKVKKGPNNKFDASLLKYFIPLGVTLSHLGMMGSNLKQLIKAGVTDRKIEELATSISLTDLQVVFDILPLAAEKIHYLQRRRELEANVEYMGDELDLLAWYLDDGFNLGDDEHRFGLFKMDLKSKELDNYIIGSANKEKVVKPELQKTKWWKDILLRIEEKQPPTWLEASYMLLNIPIDGQQEFEKLVDDMEEKMHRGTAEFPHNWILLETAEKQRKFVIAGYGYHDHLKDARNDVMGDILYDKTMEGAKGKLVIGMNIDKTHYPYSVLGSWLSSELFDNKYLKMVGQCFTT